MPQLSGYRCTIDAIDAREGDEMSGSVIKARAEQSSKRRLTADKRKSKAPKHRRATPHEGSTGAALKNVKRALAPLGVSYAEFNVAVKSSGLTVNPARLAIVARISPMAFRKTVRDLFGEPGTTRAGPGATASGRLSLADVSDRVAETVAAKTGKGSLTIGEAQAVIDAAADALPDRDDPTQALGPYYDSAGLQRRLNVTRQALHGRVERNTLLGVEADDGSRLYPVWQFGADMRVLHGLPPVLQELDRVAEDGFSKAVWLVEPSPELGGVSAAQWLAEGRDAAVVLSLAHTDVERMLR
ncbi:MAG: hypothetical protein QM582_18100 [Micropruina sp.]|uniref:hypothetical protein n=1 Tax=Micropruina sp. TaxID=2737536 RepID=UPI0039E4C1B4